MQPGETLLPFTQCVRYQRNRNQVLNTCGGLVLQGNSYCNSSWRRDPLWKVNNCSFICWYTNLDFQTWTFTKSRVCHAVGQLSPWSPHKSGLRGEPFWCKDCWVHCISFSYHPPSYHWASLVAQLLKNPPAMWETWVRSMSWEHSLEKGKATHSSILALKIPWTV